MISLLVGEVIGNQNGEVEILTTGGVGYKIFASLTAQKTWLVGKNVRVMTYLSVRENSQDLFGFVDVVEKNLFVRLLDVNGVGPKTALHILSLGSASEISTAINRGDVGYLTKVSGIGKKTAERIVVELKNKMTGASADHLGVEDNQVVGDVVDGLMAMGYTAQQARDVVKKLDANGKTSEQLLRLALQMVK